MREEMWRETAKIKGYCRGSMELSTVLGRYVPNFISTLIMKSI